MADGTDSGIKIIVTGDVSDAGLPPLNVTQIPESIRRLIESSDLLVANLEGPIKLADDYPPRRLSGHRLLDQLLRLGLRAAGKKPVLVCSTPKVIDLLALAPCACVTLANNHINDLGPRGLLDTLAWLHQHEVPHVGAGPDRDAANAPCWLRIRGKPVVVLNYNYIGIRKFGLFIDLHGAGPGRPGAAYLPQRRIRQTIGRIRAEAPEAFVLLVVHAGRVTARDLNETGVDYASFERLGAHCVVFHHSHQWFGTRTGRSFFLGDLVFREPTGVPGGRLGGFLELTVRPDDNGFEYTTHTYRFEGGYPATGVPNARTREDALATASE